MNPFSICIGLGAALGLYSLARSAKPDRVARIIDAGLVLLASALIGARAGYVLSHPEYFTTHPTEAAAFWLGGLSWVGAAAGLLAGTALVARLFHLSLDEAYRLAVLLSVPLAVFGWLGILPGGTGYGPAMDAPTWLAWPVSDETGLVQFRFPLPFLCAVLLPLFLTLLEAAAARAPGLQGNKLHAAGAALSADLLLFAFLRTDPVREIMSIRPDIPAAGFLLLVSLAALILRAPDSGNSRPAVS